MIRFRTVLGGVATMAVMIGCYSVSLKVSSERKAVADLRMQIASDQRGIRTLQAEYRTRARQGELQRWNDEVFGLQAAAVGQYVRDPMQLAAFEMKREQPPVRYAVAEAPARAPAPVRTVAYDPAVPVLDRVGDLVVAAATDPRPNVRQISLQVSR